jgi:hypothetical protein
VKSTDTLVEDIQALFDGKNLSDEVLKFSASLGDTFLKRFEEYLTEGERKHGLRMSNLGYPLRQLWYDNKYGRGEVLGPTTKMKFLFGDILESLLVFLAIEAGHEVTDLQKEVEIDGVFGHIDCILDGVVVDVKSASSRSYDRFTKELMAADPFLGRYLWQIAGYSLSLGRDGAFLVIDKQLGKIKLVQFSREELKEHYDVRKRIELARGVFNEDTPPIRCYQAQPISKTDKSGNMVLPAGCSYCSHKFRCWEDANGGKGLEVYQYSTGPRYFTKILKEPRVEKYEEFQSK